MEHCRRTSAHHIQSKACHKQHQCHERKRDQEEVPPPECVYGPDSGASEHEVHRAEAEGCEEGCSLAEPTLNEDVRGVVCDGVHAAELLPMRID